MYQGGPAHRGVASGVTLSASDLAVEWRVAARDLAAEIDARPLIPAISPPAVVDGTAYLTLTSPGQEFGLVMFALDAVDGAISWHTTVLENYASPDPSGHPRPTVVDGLVVASIPGHDVEAPVVALDAETGEVQWRDDSGRETVTGATARDGEFVLGSETAWALDANGDRTWEFSRDDPPALARDGFPPTVSEEAVYVPTRRALHALDRDGTHRWTKDLAFEWDLADVMTRPYTPVADGDSIYAPTGRYASRADGRLLALDPSDGATQWEFKPDFDAAARERVAENTANGTGLRQPLGVGVYSTPALANGRLYALGHSFLEGPEAGSIPQLFAIDAGDGSEVWSTRLPDDFGLTPPVVADGTVFAATIAGVAAVDADSGDLVDTIALDELFPRGLAVADDTLFATNGEELLGLR